MGALTVRLSNPDHAWLADKALKSGISMNAVMVALVADARKREVSFEARPAAQVVPTP